MITPLTYFIVPILIFLFIIEVAHSFKEEKHVYKRKDLFSNLIIGVGYFVCNVLSKGVLFYLFRVAHEFGPFEFSGAWYVWIVAFLAADFSYYWYHRASHEIGWFWGVHAVHHSSEEYNLSVAFRLPWVHNISGSFLFWIWMPLIGFSPLMTLVSVQLTLFYQALLHTEAIQKLPRLVEYVLNTPSHHRVHHGSDFKYLDRNHGGTLIIWDRIFGTFQQEEEKPNYGLTKKLESYDPLVISFDAWTTLLKKVARSGSWKNATNYLIQPPGWSHDGSSKTVKQMRKEFQGQINLHTNCRRNCSECPMKK